MKKNLTVILFVMVYVLSGCQKTPYNTVNKEYDTEKNTQAVTENMSTDDTNMDKEPVPVTLTEESVDEVLECGDVTVVLKGNIIKPDVYEGLCTYKAEIVNYDEYEKSMMFLFGEYEESVFRQKSGHLVCRYDEQGNNYMRLVNSSMYDENNYTGVWGSIFFTKDGNSLPEKTKVGMTNAEARVKADDIINKIGLTSFEHYSTTYHEEILQEHPDGGMSVPFGDTLTVFYVQSLQGVPVRVAECKRQVPHAQVTFDYSGVNYVSISEYTYEVMEYTDKILTYEEALEIFKKTISKDAECDGKVYDKVEFGYVLTKEYINGNFEIIAVPSWQFNFEGIPNAITSGYDVIVNAIDGSVYK